MEGKPCASIRFGKMLRPLVKQSVLDPEGLRPARTSSYFQCKHGVLLVRTLPISSEVKTAHAKVSVREADDLIRPFMNPLPCETIPLESSFGRMLREPIYADRPYPVLDRVCMNGIAIEYDALGQGTRDFRISATGKAGEAPKASAGGSFCIEVMTGAPCPVGCDTVVSVEDIVLTGSNARIK